MTHPHIPPKILRLLLNTSEDRGDIAVTLRCVLWVKAGFVVSICDIDALVASDWMRING